MDKVAIFGGMSVGFMTLAISIAADPEGFGNGIKYVIDNIHEYNINAENCEIKTQISELEKKLKTQISLPNELDSKIICNQEINNYGYLFQKFY